MGRKSKKAAPSVSAPSAPASAKRDILFSSSTTAALDEDENISAPQDKARVPTEATRPAVYVTEDYDYEDDDDATDSDEEVRTPPPPLPARTSSDA